jgi:hypothetical protein
MGWTFSWSARHTKNVPGRKSDIQECQWLLKLHVFGLLNNSFQPTLLRSQSYLGAQYRRLRTRLAVR